MCEFLQVPVVVALTTHARTCFEFGRLYEYDDFIIFSEKTMDEEWTKCEMGDNWNEIYSFNEADETINFGARSFADGINLHEACTVALIKNHKVNLYLT